MRLVALAMLAGCSFVGVRAPSRTIDPTKMAAASIHCNESGLLPGLDALGGAAAIAATGGGILSEHVSESGKPEHFTKYYAGPLFAVAIAYFWSASFGNDRISRCSDLKEAATRVQPVVTPIDDVPKSKPKDDDIEIQ